MGNRRAAIHGSTGKSALQAVSASHITALLRRSSRIGIMKLPLKRFYIPQLRLDRVLRVFTATAPALQIYLSLRFSYGSQGF